MRLVVLPVGPDLRLSGAHEVHWCCLYRVVVHISVAHLVTVGALHRSGV
jgi:hypothetical protein